MTDDKNKLWLKQEETREVFDNALMQDVIRLKARIRELEAEVAKLRATTDERLLCPACGGELILTCWSDK